MVASLQVARAAFRELWRRYGAAAVGISGVFAGTVATSRSGEFHDVASGLEWAAVLGLVPALAATGVSRWVHRGPLGLAGMAAREGATVASYGLGTALWALPFVVGLGLLATWHGSSTEMTFNLVTLGSLLLTAAGLGAAAGRLVRGGWSAAFAAWGLLAATALVDGAVVWGLSNYLPWSVFVAIAPATVLGLPAAVTASAVWLSGKARHATLALGA